MWAARKLIVANTLEGESREYRAERIRSVARGLFLRVLLMDSLNRFSREVNSTRIKRVYLLDVPTELLIERSCNILGAFLDSGEECSFLLGALYLSDPYTEPLESTKSIEPIESH